MNALVQIVSFALTMIGLHDFHLSKTEVHFNEHAQSLEITMHLFIDDLELAMGAQGMKDLYIATEKERADADGLIGKYIASAFELRVNDQMVTLNFLGKEESEDLIAIWCYLEKKEVTDIQSISIKNSLLTEIYDDQKNMVSFKGNGIKKFWLFDKSKQMENLTLP